MNDERKTRINIALVGAGFVGKMHADNLRAHPRFNLAVVCDSDLALARAAAGDGIKTTDDADSVLADDAIEAVLIATPSKTHCDFIERADGKAVLCEKPVAQTAEPATECARAIAGKKEPVQIGFNRRHDPGHAELRRRVAAGEVGKLEKLIITSRDPCLLPEAALRNCGGLFADTVVHDFDLARFILDEEPALLCVAGAALTSDLVREIGDIDTAMVVMQTASGVLCHINVSRRAAYGYDQRVEAFGEKGMLISGNHTATNVEFHTAQATSAREPLLHFFIERYAESYRLQLDAFAAAVSGECAPSPNFEDGRRAQILSDAAALSFREKKWVEVDYAL